MCCERAPWKILMPMMVKNPFLIDLSLPMNNLFTLTFKVLQDLTPVHFQFLLSHILLERLFFPTK